MCFTFRVKGDLRLYFFVSECLLCRPLVESTESDTAVFLVKGVAIGQTTVSAVVVDKNGRKIASAPQQIEV